MLMRRGGRESRERRGGLCCCRPCCIVRGSYCRLFVLRRVKGAARMLGKGFLETYCVMCDVALMGL